MSRTLPKHLILGQVFGKLWQDPGSLLGLRAVLRRNVFVVWRSFRAMCALLSLNGGGDTELAWRNPNARVSAP